MKYKKLFKGITLPLGFSLVGIPKLKRLFLIKKIKQPIYIEFIGVSGVGKSTLYKYVNKGLYKNWLDIRHFEEFNSDKVQDLIGNLPLYYNELGKYRINMVLKGEESHVEKLNAFRTGYNILKRDALLHLLNKKDIVMSDEGILQFYLDGIINLYKENKDDFLTLLKNRAVIYCYAPSEVVVNRIMDRKNKRGHLWYKHKEMSYQELIEFTQGSQKKIEDMVSILEEFIPVLKVDTTDHFKVSKQKILSFISENS